MKALAAHGGAGADALPAVRAWLRHAAAARDAGLPLDRARARFADSRAILSRFGRLADEQALADAADASPGGDGRALSPRRLGEANVLVQLAHLRTHPAVAAALARGSLTLHGWIYDIARGVVSVIDPATHRSIDVVGAQRGLDASPA